MEVVSGLHWLHGRASNAFLLVEDDGCLLVDGGMGKQIDVLGYLAKIGRKPSDLTHILITHADIDHVGDLASVQQASGARVYAGAISAGLLRDAKMPSHGRDWFNDIMHRLLHYAAIAAEPVQDGQTLPIFGGIDVVACPGHTPDHVAYYATSRGILFSGDALHTRGGKLSESGPFISADHGLAKRSADKLLKLTPAVFAPGHGKPLHTHSADDLMMLRQKLTK